MSLRSRPETQGPSGDAASSPNVALGWPAGRDGLGRSCCLGLGAERLDQISEPASGPCLIDRRASRPPARLRLLRAAAARVGRGVAPARGTDRLDRRATPPPARSNFRRASQPVTKQRQQGFSCAPWRPWGPTEHGDSYVPTQAPNALVDLSASRRNFHMPEPGPRWARQLPCADFPPEPPRTCAPRRPRGPEGRAQEANRRRGRGKRTREADTSRGHEKLAPEADTGREERAREADPRSGHEKRRRQADTISGHEERTQGRTR